MGAAGWLARRRVEVAVPVTKPRNCVCWIEKRVMTSALPWSTRVVMFHFSLFGSGAGPVCKPATEPRPIHSRLGRSEKRIARGGVAPGQVGDHDDAELELPARRHRLQAVPGLVTEAAIGVRDQVKRRCLLVPDAEPR